MVDIRQDTFAHTQRILKPRVNPRRIPGSSACCHKRTSMYYKGVKTTSRKGWGPGRLSTGGNGVWKTKGKRSLGGAPYCSRQRSSLGKQAHDSTTTLQLNGWWMVGARFLTVGRWILQEDHNKTNSIQRDSIYFYENRSRKTLFWRRPHWYPEGCRPQGPSGPQSVFLENMPKHSSISLFFLLTTYRTQPECFYRKQLGCKIQWWHFAKYNDSLRTKVKEIGK